MIILSKYTAFKYLFFISSFLVFLASFPIVPLNSNLSPILIKCFNCLDDKLVIKFNRLNNKLLLYAAINKILVTATAYSASKSECDDTPFITASGKNVRSNIIAVSRDLYKSLPFGSKVKINNKIYIVDDLMNKRWKKRIDFFMWSKSQAKTYGNRKVIMQVMEVKKKI